MIFGNPRIPMEISALRRLHSRADAKTLNLGLGQPEVDMPEDLREIALEAIGRSGLGYTANAGRSDLRELVARHYELETEEVLISHGAQEGLMATLIALVSPGDEILVPDPGFLAYPKMISLAGGKAVPYSLRAKKGFCYDPELILSKVTPRTRAVILCSPNNPCGTMISAKDQKELLAELEKRGIFLLCDDVYAELAFRDPYKPASKESQYAVVINSWSKSLALPGWRIGFVHTRHRLLFKKILSAHQFLSTCANAPAQALMVAVLSRPALYAKTLNGFRSTYERRLKTHCKSLDLDCPAGGFYLFPRIKSRNSESFANKLLKTHNLLVVPGSYFGREGSQYLRVSLATPDRVLKKAIPLLKEQLSVGNGGAR